MRWDCHQVENSIFGPGVQRRQRGRDGRINITSQGTTIWWSRKVLRLWRCGVWVNITHTYYRSSHVQEQRINRLTQ